MAIFYLYLLKKYYFEKWEINDFKFYEMYLCKSILFAQMNQS